MPLPSPPFHEPEAIKHPVADGKEPSIGEILPVILGPNITGIFTTHNHNPYLSGAFSGAGTNGVGLGYASTIPVLMLKMDASKCSAIYSKGKTVQPSSLILNYVIKY
uniref:hypothetical protein n=1 Tax=Succinivibrio sp. TaxID=2053619 RepID=UPI00402A8A46